MKKFPKTWSANKINTYKSVYHSLMANGHSAKKATALATKVVGPIKLPCS